METISLAVDASASLKNALAQIQAETARAQVGSTEGLVPLYALTDEAKEAASEHPPIVEALKALQTEIEGYLDRCAPFDDALLGQLHCLSTWVEGELADETDAAEEPYAAIPDLNEEAPSFLPAEEAEETESPSEEATEDTLLTLGDDEDDELLDEFVTEATEHLEAIEGELLVLEQTPKDAESLATIFRAFHSIKGVAGFLQLLPIQDLAHEVESLLDQARSEALTLDSGMITLILQARDRLNQLVAQVSHYRRSGERPSEIVPVQELITAAKAAIERGLKGETESAPPSSASATEPVTNAKTEESQAATPAMTLAPPATVRVDSERVANLMDTVGELVIVESQLADSATELSNENALMHRNLGQLSRITRDLQHTAMALRMVPIKPCFQKVGRVVRDLARSFGKEVSFVTSGEDTELDRNVVEQINDPLVHMVRNSLDHGLEATPEDRVSSGKSREGKIELKAYHQGSTIVIELSDDGRGLDPEKILTKARERGLVEAERELSEEEIHQLIFLPGFSTAAKVTDVSGRGVGMDVVRRNIESLRGSVVVQSEVGKGTTFQIKLPLTTAIIEGLIVRVGDERYILPTHTVRVTIRPEPNQLTRLLNRTEVVQLREQTIRLLRLHELFGIPDAVADPTEGSVVIIDALGSPFALLVDEMVGKQEVVIKNLGVMARHLRGVTGGAILGDGSIALILDPAALPQLA